MTTDEAAKSRRGCWGCAIAATCVVGLGGALLYPAVQMARIAARRSQDK